MGISYRENLRRAWQGEVEAVRLYTELAQKAPNKEIAGRIADIAEDESRHATYFAHLISSTANIMQEYYKDTYAFKEGILAAYKDEVQTVSFYAQLSLEAPDMATAMRIRDIMRDEVIHAEFFGTLVICDKYFPK
ncbi:MAG: ferritin-like domain-containing protein [Clostridia bacterium]|nr:ferritin-like domain-containing protein [Clostridia bacterium]